MPNEIYGPIDYAKMARAIAGSDIGNQPYVETFSVSGGQTLMRTDDDFNLNTANIISVLTVVSTGSTDLDVSIHEDDSFDKTDMIYRATGVSSADAEPTGGPTAQGSGIPFVENSGLEQIHLKFVENSGVAAAGFIKIYYI